MKRITIYTALILLIVTGLVYGGPPIPLAGWGTNRIVDGDSSVIVTDTGTGSIVTTVDGVVVSTATASGVAITITGGAISATSLSVPDAVEPTDAVNYRTLLNNLGFSFNFWIGSKTLDQTLTDAEASYTETQNASPDTLSTIYFVASEADTQAPFTVPSAAIIELHYAAKLTTVASVKDTTIYLQLGYVDSDGSSNFVQIGSNSDSTANLTTTKTEYLSHIHVPTEITVPVTKRLYLRVVAVAPGAGNYGIINFYYDAVAYQIHLPVNASILENFALKSVVGTSIGTGLTLDGTVLKTHVLLQSIAATAPAAGQVLVASSGTAYTPTGTTGTGDVVRGTSPTIATPTLTGDVAGDGSYFKGLQNIPDLASKGPAYWFDGVGSYISLGTFKDTQLDYGTGDFTYVSTFKTLSTDVSLHLVGCYEDVNNRFYINLPNGTGILILGKEESTTKFQYTATNANVIAVNQWTTLGIVGDRSDALYVYVNGKSVALTVDIAMTAGDIDTNATMYLGRYGSEYSDIEIANFNYFNLALTAAEVKAFSSGAPVPYKYIGASQTEFFTTATDRTFTGGATNWENVDIGTTWDETTDLSIVASATGQYGKITFTNIGTVLEIGKRYRLTYDYAETTAGFEFKLGGATGQTLGDAVAGTGQMIEFTAIEPYTTTDFLGIYAKTTATAAGDFDNFSLVQIGCVLQLEQPGITPGTWVDTSGNELHGVVSEVIPINLQKGVKRLLSVKNVSLAASADTALLTTPAGYNGTILDSATVVAGGDAYTVTMSIGQNTAETDFIPANSLSNLDAALDVVILKPIPSTTPLKNKSYAAGTVIDAKVVVDGTAGSATNMLYLYGTLY